jgi:hypothetical protein
MSEAINNQALRIQTLKHIIKHLHEGQAPEQVKRQMREIIKQTDHSEIIAMEQQLIAEGMPVDEVRSMCDLHSQITREFMVQRPGRPELLPGHPVDTFKSEDKALRRAIADERTAIAEICTLADGEDFGPVMLRVRLAFSYLMEVDKHYKRKENVLFPFLERHGITGPSKVMWAKDDEIRSLLAQAGALLDQCGQAKKYQHEAASAMERVLAAMEEMIYKEENILLPMALDTLTEQEWAEIWRSSPTYGWCLIEPGRGYIPASVLKPKVSESPIAITLPTGNCTVEQLQAIFATLPMDMTFVDTDDRVAFYTAGPGHIFKRIPAIVGRKVQYCHPVKSIDLVDRILTDFREGRRDVAEFWIHLQEKYVYIRFFAVRDQQNKFMGTLELVQDIAPLQRIEGERRLLDEDHASAAREAELRPI